jgi:hypothetical protein
MIDDAHVSEEEKSSITGKLILGTAGDNDMKNLVLK